MKTTNLDTKETVEVITKYQKGKKTKYSINGDVFRTKEEIEALTDSHKEEDND